MMSGPLHVIQAALGTAWAMQPQKLAMVAHVLARWSKGEKLNAAEIQARIGDSKGAPQQGAGVAVLPLYGIIGHRMNQVQDISGPGGTSTEQFGQWFDAALNDPAIGAIVIDVDSPGGSVSGVPELAAKIFNARGQKPIIAIANSLAASAAYWIASAAEEFWCTPSGDVGSIGVYTLHQDFSAAFAEAGITNTLLSAGKFKVEGNPYEPLDDEARAAVQDRIDEYYAEFTKAVALHRGVTAADVRSGFGEGRVVSAVRAKRLGMVDKVGTLDTLLGKLGAGGSRSRLKATDLAPSMQLSAGAIERLEQYEASERITDEARALVERQWGEPVGAVIERVHEMLDAIIDAAPAAAVPSQDRAGVAADPVVIPIHGADEAKEFAMLDKGTPVAEAAEQAALAAQKETDRVTALTKLASDDGTVSMTTLQSWISGKFSVEQAQAALITDLKANRAAQPVIRHSVSPLDGGENGTKAGPFATLGDQLVAIREHAMAPGGRATEKLLRAQEVYGAVSGASAGSGPDGGFLIQKDFVADLVKEAQSESVLAQQCSAIELSANSDSLETVSIQEASRVTGSRNGGMQVFRAAEADTVTATKPEIDRSDLRIEDLRGIFYATDRLMRDASAMGQVVEEAFREEFSWTLDDEIYRANGVARCLGVTKAGCRIEVAKESGQAADTVVAANVINMWSRIRPRSQARGNWYYNPELLPQLMQMKIGTGTSATLVFMPPSGLSGAPYGTMFGRPAIPLEQCSAPGDVGDLSFLDLSRYRLITKGGIQADSSPHVRFIYWEGTFRWSLSINGAPRDKFAVTPAYGSATTSPFVFLEAR